ARVGGADDRPGDDRELADQRLPGIPVQHDPIAGSAAGTAAHREVPDPRHRRREAFTVQRHGAAVGVDPDVDPVEPVRVEPVGGYPGARQPRADAIRLGVPPAAQQEYREISHVTSPASTPPPPAAAVRGPTVGPCRPGEAGSAAPTRWL